MKLHKTVSRSLLRSCLLGIPVLLALLAGGCEGDKKNEGGAGGNGDYSGTWYFTDPPVYRINGHHFTMSTEGGKVSGTISFPNPSARYSEKIEGTISGDVFQWQYRTRGGCAGTIFVTGTFTSSTTAEGQDLTGPNGCPDAGSVMPWKAEKR